MKNRGIHSAHLVSILGSKSYSDKVLGYNPIAYYPLWEASGNTAYDISGNGFDAPAVGVTWGQSGIGDGNTAALFDGLNDHIDPPAAFKAAWSPTIGAVGMWVRVFNVGVWADGNSRIPFYVSTAVPDAVYFQKTGAPNNTFNGNYRAGGVEKAVAYNTARTDWFYIFQTFKDANNGNRQEVFIDGGSIGNNGGFGVFTPPLTGAEIGCCWVGGFHWYGYIAHLAVFDYVPSDPAILDMATV